MMNKSPSKQTHMFSKADRFPQIKSNSKAVAASAVNMKSDFDAGCRRTQVQFLTTTTRFRYYNTSQKHGNLPSPNAYNTADRTFSLDVSRKNGKTFGVSRAQIQKLHIDKEVDTINKKLGSPPPTNYEPLQTFGKVGPKYSVQCRLYRYGQRNDGTDNYYFAQQKKLPGPGFYNAPDTVGTQQVNSMFHTSRSGAFPKAIDRFAAPTKHKVQPSPDSYTPKIGADSLKPKAVMTKFGMNNTDVLDSQWSMKSHRAIPGPGAYETITEFAK